MYDLTVAKMKKVISAAKARYGGIAFAGLSADTWSSRRSQGFLAIELSFVYEDDSGKNCMAVMCLSCQYFPGSHTGKAVADAVREALAKFGLEPDDIVMYVSDSGGGIPAAAKELGIFRLACALHVIDTIVGRALAEKGKGSGLGARAHGDGAAELKAFMGRVKEQASIWRKANIKLEQLKEVHDEEEDLRKALALAAGIDAVLADPFSMLEQPNCTRMWSQYSLVRSTWRSQRDIDAWVSKHDPRNPKHLPLEDRQLLAFIVSILLPLRNAQKAVEASSYPTASFTFATVHDLKRYYNGDNFSIFMNPGDKEPVLFAFSSMPRLAQFLVRNLAMEFEHYFPRLSAQEAFAAFLDPRTKRHPELRPRADGAKRTLKSGLVKVIVPMLRDDPGLEGSTENGKDVECLGVEPAPSLAPPAYVSTVAAMFGEVAEAPTLCAAPRAASVTRPKSREEKGDEIADKLVAAWDAMDMVQRMLYGPGSSGFSLLEFYDKLRFNLGKEADLAFKAVAMAAFGFRASAAGPETIFSRSGLICTALRNRISVWNMELLVFLFKNSACAPSVDETVAEILRRKKVALAQRTKSAKRAAAEAPADGMVDDADDFKQQLVEEGLPSDIFADPDPAPIVLTSSEVQALCEDATEFRLGDDPDCDESGTDLFAEFINERALELD